MKDFVMKKPIFVIRVVYLRIYVIHTATFGTTRRFHTTNTKSVPSLDPILNNLISHNQKLVSLKILKIIFCVVTFE